MITLKWTKVTISGPPGSGKSSTLKLLLDEDPDPLHTSTPVVKTFLARKHDAKPWGKVPSLEEVISPVLPSPHWSESRDNCNDNLNDENDEQDEEGGEEETDFDKDPNHFIYAIDTGGQAAFYDIAPAIIRYDSVNVITHKLNESLQAETSFFYSFEGEHVGLPIKRKLTNEQVLELSIRSFTSVDTQQLELQGIDLDTQRYGDKPNILVLGTFRDVANEDDIKSKNDTLRKRLKKFEKDASFLEQEGQPLFTINAVSRSSDEKRRADLIRSKVCNSYVQATIPKKWFEFLESLKGLSQSIVDISVCREKGAEWFMTYDEVEKALQFYHNLTVVLYFTEIPNIVFLDPQLLFDELTELISISFADHADFIETMRKIDLPPNAHDDLKEKGIFKRTLLEAIGTSFQLDDFLKLPEGLNIVVKIPFADTHLYFLPCVLTARESLDLREELRQNVDPLILWWEGKIIPQGLFCALVLHLLKEDDFDVNGFCSQSYYRYHNAIQLPCRNNLDGTVLLIDSVNYLEIYYSGQISNCFHLREIILTQLRKVVKTFHYNPRLANPETCFLRQCCHCVFECDRKFCCECVRSLSRDGNKSMNCTLVILLIMWNHLNNHLG